MENDTVNASRVALPVLRYTNTDTLKVDGTKYRVIETHNTGDSPVWFYRITESETDEPVYFAHLFRVFGYGSEITLIGDAIASPRGISNDILAGLIAGAIAYDRASSLEWESTH